MAENENNILIYENQNGAIKVDVRFEDEELSKEVVVRNFLTTTKHEAIQKEIQKNDSFSELVKDIKAIK